MNLESVYPDPERPSAIQKLRDYNLNVKEVRKERDSVQNGIDLVRQLLKEGRLKVHKRCVDTIEEFESYRWKEKPRTATDDINAPEEPEKANDHCMDSTRYCLFMAHNKRKEITPAQMRQLYSRRRNAKVNQAKWYTQHLTKYGKSTYHVMISHLPLIMAVVRVIWRANQCIPNDRGGGN